MSRIVFKQMNFKKLAYKIHTYISLIFCIPFIIVCLSGSLLVYKDEINDILSPDAVNVSLPSGQQNSRLGFDELRRIISAKFPDYEIVGWNIDKNLQKSDKIWLIKHNGKEWEYIYLDAFSGEIKSEPTPHDSGFMGVLVELHENLLFEERGQIFVGVVGVIAFVIAISGFIVYRNFWKNLFKLRFTRLAIFMSDIHKFIGVFSTPIMLIIALSGAWWELRFLFSKPFDTSEFTINSQIYNKNLSLDEIAQKAKTDLPNFELHYISLPFRNAADISLFGYKRGQNFLYNEYSSMLTYSRQNANLLQIKDIDEADITERFLATFRKAHFGYYNQITKFIWFLVGLTPLILSVSGIYLWIKRSNFKKRKNER